MMNRMKNAGIITLFYLFNAAGHAEDQHSCRQQDNQGVPRHTGKFVLLISVKNCSGSVLISEPVSAPNALPQHPADDDGVADGNTERAGAAGIVPRMAPPFFAADFIANSYEPIGPEPVMRPKANSPDRPT